MVPALDRRGFDSSVILLKHADHGMERQLAATGTPVTVLTAGSRPAQMREIRRRIRAAAPDLVWTTLYDATLLGRLAVIGLGVPVVTSVVNTSYLLEQSGPAVRRSRLEVARRLDSLTARRLGSRFHAITNAVRDHAVETLGVDPALVTVIPRGRDRALLGEPSPQRRAAARDALGVAEGEVMLLNVGRREWQKGQMTLVEATALLVDRVPRLKVFVAGKDGGQSSALTARTADLGLDGIVTFLGQRSDVPDLLAAADLFVFPSRFEGLGGAVLEAMAMQVPIVASDVPAVRELLADGVRGALVPVDDAAAFANSIQGVLLDPERCRAMARRAREAADGEYEFESVMDRMAAWLEAGG